MDNREKLALVLAAIRETEIEECREFPELRARVGAVFLGESPSPVSVSEPEPDPHPLTKPEPSPDPSP